MAHPFQPLLPATLMPGGWPVLCPTCTLSSGYIRGVHACADGVRLIYRCRDCGHDWTRDRPLLAGCHIPH